MRSNSMNRFAVRRYALLIGAVLLCSAGPAAAEAMPSTMVEATRVAAVGELQEVTVTTSRLSLIGTATTASQGVVVNDELALTPAYRPGQLLETVPGLEVTLHSGEGKANQYLMRGYNLDHGTDLATFVDGMPVNEPTHAHGQGYTDLNFMIPALATNIALHQGHVLRRRGRLRLGRIGAHGYLDYHRRPGRGDHRHLGLRALSSRPAPISRGHRSSCSAPWSCSTTTVPGTAPTTSARSMPCCATARAHVSDGYSLTGMFYRGLWNSTTDQPERAIAAGLIGRFGTLDPSDGGQAQRASLSVQYRRTFGDGQFRANAYVFNNQMTLWNDFTHL